MHGVAGVMTALLLAAASNEGEAATSATVPLFEPRRMFVGVTVPLMDRNGFSVEGEREVDEHVSVNLGLRVAFDLETWNGLLGESDEAYLRVGLEPGARFYLTGSSLNGMWVGPRLEVAHGWRELNDGEHPVRSLERAWSVGGAVLTGYSLRLGRGFTVQAALGVGLTYERGTVSEPTTLTSGGGLLELRTRYDDWSAGPRGQLAVGWTF
ncbi:DUF3575 domain-containing protein [Archangium violaceum]|uniref:DUF3575 domain-containing protein n=1 Tax=Archangium violaceum TaxID=83451 RepID=UPI0019517412|nr:DUF3575 domain-containing protein [Archangium violaceum]QRN97460.1 DUF3575 domain-containing protein [Archangium violaceum]